MDPRRHRQSKKQNRRKGEGPGSSQQSTDRGSLEALKCKSLYICTSQYYFGNDIKWVVHRIKMSDVLSSSSSSSSSSSGSEKVGLDQVVIESGRLTLYAGCGVFKSAIFIGGGFELEKFGTQIDANDEESYSLYPPPSKRMFSVSVQDQRVNPFFPSLTGGKQTPLLMEIKGELYAIDGDQYRHRYAEERFERFDQQTNQWKPLQQPPFWDPLSAYFKTRSGLNSVITDTDILISRGYKSTPIFRFDFTNPDAGWSETKLKYFPFKGTTLVHSYRDDGFFIIFAIDVDPKCNPTRFPRIKVYRMPKGYDGFYHIGTMELPSTDLPPIFKEPNTHKFFDLGRDQKAVGLVLSVFDIGRDYKMLKFLVATFQYKLSPFSYRCLSNPLLPDYDVLENPVPPTEMAEMLGAFVL